MKEFNLSEKIVETDLGSILNPEDVKEFISKLKEHGKAKLICHCGSEDIIFMISNSALNKIAGDKLK